ELFDRQVIDTHDLDALIDEIPRRRFGHVRVVLMEHWRVPQRRIRRAQQHAQVFAQPRGREVFLGDAAAVRQVDDAGPADEQVERQRVDAGTVVEEVLRRVDVGARVAAHVEPRYVGGGPPRDLQNRLDTDV